MPDRFPGAMLVSITLHALVVGLMFLFAYAAEQSKQETTKVFLLVAGEGDNFGATEAPKLGAPDGIKMDVPQPPAPKPEEVKPAEVAPAPAPAPVTPTPPKPTEKPLPKPVDISKRIERKVANADKKAKVEIAKEHAAEAKTTKADFDKEPKKKVTTTPAAAPKVARIDAEGIRKGVENSTSTSKDPGAGGTALTRSEGTLMEMYYAMLQKRLRAALEKPPGLSDTLVTIVQVRINPDGSLTGAKITKSSGSAEFDAAVMAAVAAVQMPPRPDKKSEVVNLPFRMKEQDEG